MESVVKTWDDKDSILRQQEEDKDRNFDDDDNDIMSHLNYRKLEEIKKDFMKNEEQGLSLEQFVKVMLHHLPETKDRNGLVKNLIELFKQIDVNNDKTLEWEEFTNHIIELGMVRKDRTFIDAIKSYYASDIKDTEKHDTEVEHMYYIEKLRHLLVMERDSKRFKVYNAKNGRWIQNVPEKNAGSGGAVIAADYIELGNIKFVATTSNNNSINFWDSNNYIFRERLNTSEIQMTIKWCGEGFNRLFTGGCDAVIHAYDVQKLKEIGVREGWNPLKKDKIGHDGPIMDLLPIPGQQILASAGLDAQICLWSLKDLEAKHSLVGHQLGIYSLDWYDDQHLLLSAGLDHDIYIWNPYVKKKIFLLKGHNHSLVGVKWLKGSNQIISADISGMFRIWDLRTFTTVQTFNCPLNEINCFSVTWPPKRIVAGGRRLVFYDYDEPTDHHLADDQACLCVLYNPVFYTFITAHPKCVKVWNATNGELQSVFRDLTTKEITCICLDQRKRKLFVGDQKGRLFSINIKNGAKMKKFKKNKKTKRDKDDISSLYYWGEDDESKPPRNILIAASWDGKVRLYDDSTADQEGSKRYTMKKHKDSVNFIDFNPDHQLCASCSDDGSIVIYNYGSYRQEGILKVPIDAADPHAHLAEVKVVKFLAPFHCLVSSDLDGFLHFWAVTPSSRKNELLCSVKNDNISEVGTKVNFPIRAIDFDAKRRFLFTGDEMGYMHKWDLGKLLEKLEKIKEIETKQSYKTDLLLEDTTSMAKGRFKKEFSDAGSTFVTGLDAGGKHKIEFVNSDVTLAHRWKAHADCINWVTYAPEIDCLASCSFDCNVYMWDIEGQKIGSLVLGTEKLWKISIDKRSKNEEEKQEAERMLDKVSHINYETMFNKQKKEKQDQMSKVLQKDQLESQIAEQRRLEGLTEDERNRRILDEV